MRKLIFIILVLVDLAACEKMETAPEEKGENPDFIVKVITADDGKIVVIFDFISMINAGEESQSLGDWITGFLKNVKRRKFARKVHNGV